jgi:hypothetical protein
MGGDLTTDRDRSMIDCYGFRRLGSVRCPRGGWGSGPVAAMMPPGRIAATVTAASRSTCSTTRRRGIRKGTLLEARCPSGRFCQADLQICESAILSKTLLAVAVVDVDRVVGR